MERTTNRTLVTISVFLATFMTAIEGTIVSTAMPTIVGSLHGMEMMNWVFSIYLLTSAMLTPIYGKLADKMGRKPIFMVGILIFIIGSSLCGISQSMVTLIIARAVQGVGAGAIMPVALTILADIYPIEQRAKMLGLNSAAWGIASIFGPIVGGMIVDTIGWHWIFFINVPFGLLLLGLTAYFLVEPKNEKTNESMDILGSIQLMLVLLTLLLGFQLIGDHGFDGSVGLCIGASLFFLISFIWLEKRAVDPVIDLQLFRNSTFVLVNVIAALVSGYLMGIEVYIPMWMQGVLGKSAGIGGLILAPMSVLWMVGSFIASTLIKKLSIKKVIGIGLAIIFVGGTALICLSISVSFLWFLVISASLGIGFGIAITTTTVAAQSSVAANEVGVATSFVTLVRTIGQTIMVSVFGVMINAVTTAELAKSSLHVSPDILNQLVNPHTAKQLGKEVLPTLRMILFTGIHQAFIVGLGLIVLASLFNALMRQPKSNKRHNC